MSECDSLAHPKFRKSRYHPISKIAVQPSVGSGHMRRWLVCFSYLDTNASITAMDSKEAVALFRQSSGALQLV
jgi:hypothetical protein